jgi:hypothetical protein
MQLRPNQPPAAGLIPARLHLVGWNIAAWNLANLVFGIAAAAFAGPACSDDTAVQRNDTTEPDADGGELHTDSDNEILPDPDVTDGSSPPETEEIHDVNVIGPCETVTIPELLRWEWADRNHRIRQLGLWPERNNNACTFETVEMSFVGGDFTTGEVDTDLAIRSSRWTEATLDETVTAWVVRTTVVIPAGGRLTTELPITLPDAPDTAGSWYVLVSGFDFDTNGPQTADYPADVYSPTLGFTTRGLGVSAEVSTPTPQSYALNITVRFEHGRARDDFFRPDLNATFALAQSSAQLEFTVLFVADAGQAATGSVSYVQESPEPLRFTDELDPPVDVEQQTARIPEWLVPLEQTLLGWTAFDMRLYPQLACNSNRDCDSGDVCENGQCAFVPGPPGDYVRAISLDLSAPLTNVQQLILHGYASSASKAVALWPMRNEFDASAAAISVQGVRRFEAAATGPAGTESVALQAVTP